MGTIVTVLFNCVNPLFVNVPLEEKVGFNIEAYVVVSIDVLPLVSVLTKPAVVVPSTNVGIVTVPVNVGLANGA